MKELRSNNGVDIVKEINSPELSKYWCFVNILWLWAKYSFKSSAMYTVITEKNEIDWCAKFLNEIVLLIFTYVGKGMKTLVSDCIFLLNTEK